MSTATTHDTDHQCPSCDVALYRFGDWGAGDAYLECPTCGDRFAPSGFDTESGSNA